MKKLYTFALALLTTASISAQTVVYSNDFNSGVGTATIVGNGVVESATIAGYGSVFHNAAGGQGLRSNFLLLPDNVLASSAVSKELTIAFWVNKGTAVDYFWTPIFSAYGAAPIGGANTWPMMVLQSRLVAQVNCAGWTDLTGTENVTGANAESTAWLDNAEWHYYTATFTETSVKIYVDGVVKNAWNVSATGGNTVNGLFSNGADLKYICLGGNQAWGWSDPDPAYLFDDLVIYSNALTPEQITSNMNAKIVTGAADIAASQSELISEEFYTITGAKAGNDYVKLGRGIFVKKSVYSNGEVKNTKIEKTL